MTTRTRVIIIGVGGASCSGKTLLAKHLAKVLPQTLLIHQDDFAPSSDDVPISEEHGVQDWDDPETCIDWPRMRTVLEAVKYSGKAAETHRSFQHLNKQVEVPVDDRTVRKYTAQLAAESTKAAWEGERVQFVLVEGWTLYYDEQIQDALDVKLLIRVPRETLKARREERSTYKLQNAADAANGGVWTDPPNYFDNIVYPAYVKAHKSIVAGGDVENGAVTVKDITVLTPGEGEEEETRVLSEACEAILSAVQKGAGTYITI